MFTDSKSLSFLPVLAPKIVLINYSLFGSKTLLFLGIIFGNLFIAVRENAFILLLFFSKHGYFKQRQFKKVKIEDIVPFVSIHFFQSSIQEMLSLHYLQ